MRYDNPEMLRQLAAEYVIGTLRGPARQRFETLLEDHEEARFQVDFWEQRLGEFGQIVRPVIPPPQTRAELIQRAAVAAPDRARPRRHTRRRRGRWLRSYAAGFGTAAALVLAFLFGQRNAGEPDAAEGPRTLPVSDASTPAPGLPIYVAQMRMPASSMQWLLSVTPDHKQLVVVAAEDFLQIGRHRLQLWSIDDKGVMLPLGVLPNERDAGASFVLPPSLRGQRTVRFMVSLEPERGPREDGPSSLVLDEATAIDAI
jgi:anti-sigma-K factor RskA